MTPRRTIALGAAVVTLVMGVGAAGQGGPTRAPEPAGEVVPAEKFKRVHALYHRERREAVRLRAVLRHEPSVDEALTLASIVYRIDRGDLSSTAFCESRHDPRAENGQYLGIMQLGDGFRAASPFFPALDPHSPYANVMAAAQVIAVQGYRQWQCRPGGKLAW